MKKILLVEDDPTLARLIPLQLTKYGCKVVAVAKSGEDGIVQAARLVPELILMDVDLQGEINGITAAATIQKTQDIPIIFISSHADERGLQTQDSGPFSCLLKPLTEKELAMAIELNWCRHQAKLDRRRLTEELQAALMRAKFLENTCPRCGANREG